MANYLERKLAAFDQLSERAFRPFVIGLFIGNLTYLVGIYFVGERTHRLNYFSNIYLIIPFLGGVNGLIRLWIAHKANHPIKHTYRAAVTWFCIGLVCWAVGCAIGMAYSLKFGVSVPFVWWGDAFFTACFICWTIGIIRLYNLAELNFLKEIKDVAPFLILILVAAVGVIIKAIKAYGNTLSAQSSIHDVLTFAAYLFFPVVDLFNLTLLITLIPKPTNKQLSRQVRGSRFGLIVLGYSLLCVASYSFSLTNNLPVGTTLAYYNGGFTDGVFALAFTILSVAISLISLKELSQDESSYEIRR